MERPGFGAREPRRNLMLAGQIAAGDFCAPVRIRNLSQGGAMVDGVELPEPGSQFLLRRLELEMVATVVWTHRGRGGLKFAGRINIEEWVAGVRKPTLSGVTAEQLRVDRIQAALRKGSALPEDRPVDGQQRSLAPLLARLAQELARLETLVADATDGLSDDTHVLMRHEKALQALDLATTTLASLAAVAAADEPERAIAGIVMHELRGRLSGSPTLT